MGTRYEGGDDDDDEEEGDEVWEGQGCKYRSLKEKRAKSGRRRVATEDERRRGKQGVLGGEGNRQSRGVFKERETERGRMEGV